MRKASEVEARLAGIRERIRAAAERSGRSPAEIALVGASKRQPVERLKAAHAAGLRDFGENRVQEGEAKREQMPADLTWHLLGPLQSNKVKRAVATFDLFHAVDRAKIAAALERHADAMGRTVSAFLEVNLGEESSKHGFSPGELVQVAAEMASFGHLRIVGLMAIPPYEEDREAARAWFRRLVALRDELSSQTEWNKWPGYLSMGMSHDFEVAIEEGATHVRVGTALFGERPRD